MPINYGSDYPFKPDDVANVSMAVLDATHFVVAYRDINDGNLGKAIIGTVNGDVITYGSEYTFNAAITRYSSVDALDATHFVIGYEDFSDGKKGKAIVGTVSSGDVIGYGSEYTFNAVATSGTNAILVASLDATHFTVGYKDSGGDGFGHAKVGVVTGNVITYGSEYTFHAEAVANLSVAALDATHFVVAYRDRNDDKYGHAKVGVVSSGNVISFGAEYTYEAETHSGGQRVAALDSTHFVVAYIGLAPDPLRPHGRAKVGIVSSGDVIAFGSEYTFNEAWTAEIDVTVLDAAEFIIAYRDYGDSSKGNSVIGTVSSEDVVAFGSEYTFNAGNGVVELSMGTLDSTHIVISHRELNGDGLALVGTVTVEEPASVGAGYLWQEGTDLHFGGEDGLEVIESLSLLDSGSEVPGHLWIEATKLHVIDEDGDERGDEGTATGDTGPTGTVFIEDSGLHYLDEATGAERIH